MRGAEIVPEIRALFASADLSEWAARLDDAGLIWAPVAELPEVIEDPGLRQAGAFELIQHPRAGAMETIAAPFWIRDADIAVRGPAPDLGQHTREIFEAAGIPTARIQELFERRVLA